jgi:hypothetical protein
MAGRRIIMVTTGSRTLARRAVVLATVVVFTPTPAGFGAPGGAQVPGVLPPAAQAVAALLEDHIATLAFEQSVSDYARMHRLLEGPLPMPPPSADMRIVQAVVDELGARIQAARQGARQGDIFTDAVARMFRRRMASCLSPEDLEAILAGTHPEDGRPEGAGAQSLRVNAGWPAHVLFDFVPPNLLAALPPLPPELQYRTVGRSLVLWDHHANLVVDYLPAVLTT